MKAFIKSSKNFNLVHAHDVTAADITVGGKSKVTVWAPEAKSIIKSYVGQWCILDSEVFFVDAANPKDDLLELTLQHPSAAFTRDLPFISGTTYGDLIATALAEAYQRGSGDSNYVMPYLAITNHDSTAYEVEVDDYGIFSLKTVLEDALEAGVRLSFTATGDHSQILQLVINPPEAETTPVVFEDGHHLLSSETYDTSFIAKATVIQAQENEDPESDEQTFVQADYYAYPDGSVSTIPPEPRIDGDWIIVECVADDDPLEKAKEALVNDKTYHKIVFTSDREYRLHQKLKLRLRGEIFLTEVTKVRRKYGEDWMTYECGNLRTTLQDIVAGLSPAQPTTVNGKRGNVLIPSGGGFKPGDIQSATLTNVASGGRLGYYKVGNVVTIQYDFRPAQAGASLQLCTIPDGYRPLLNLTQPAGQLSAYQQNVYLDVRTDGTVRCYAGSITRMLGVLTYATKV